ncbi:GNAT family N-acetyltransferase [Tenacibaculum amylolyticum]|uniref:GNAT family N-acetyltransferase n=1 Tax=Tenacibaculum amylolyticum TaxID=104269 RepID=UPI003894BD34
MVSVKKIAVEDTYFIRQEILRKGMNLPYTFDGDDAEDTFHIGVYEREKIVSIGTFMKRSSGVLEGAQYQLRGMATLNEARGKGYGKLLLDFATKELLKLNITYLWCNARVVAVKFYEKNQFQIIGESFMVAIVGPHYKMYKTIKNENN